MELELHRIEELEKKTERLGDRVMSMDKSLAVYSAVFEKTLQTQEKLATSIDRLSETTSELKNTLTKIQADITRNSEEQIANSNRIKDLEVRTDGKIRDIETGTDEKIKEIEKDITSKFTSLNSEVKAVDEKTKFDIMKFIKENFATIVLAVYVIANSLNSVFDVLKKMTGGTP
jgi:chromosome segregation ATPase